MHHPKGNLDKDSGSARTWLRPGQVEAPPVAGWATVLIAGSSLLSLTDVSRHLLIVLVLTVVRLTNMTRPTKKSIRN